MFSRTVLVLLLSCIASSLAAELLLELEKTTELNVVSSLSEVEVLLSAGVCAFGSVAIVLVPTLLYYKLWSERVPRPSLLTTTKAFEAGKC